MIRSWLDRLVLAVGVSALALAVVFAVAPTVLSPVVDLTAVERELTGTVAAVTVAGTLLLGVVIAVRKKRVSEDWSRRAADRTDDESGAGVHAFDETVEQAVETGDRERRAEVRDQLRAVAVDVLAATREESVETAPATIDTGEWTDDPVVAAFLGDTEAAAVPLRWRLYEWIYRDRAFERTVERTLTAIENCTEGE